MFYDELNIIIQLPYVIKSQHKQDKASKRRKEIEDQLINNPYGIAYFNIDEKCRKVNMSSEVIGKDK